MDAFGQAGGARPAPVLGLDSLLRDACGSAILLGAFKDNGDVLALNDAARPFFLQQDEQAGGGPRGWGTPQEASGAAADADMLPNAGSCSLASFFRLEPHVFDELQTAVRRGKASFSTVLPVPRPAARMSPSAPVASPSEGAQVAVRLPIGHTPSPGASPRPTQPPPQRAPSPEADDGDLPGELHTGEWEAGVGPRALTTPIGGGDGGGGDGNLLEDGANSHSARTTMPSPPPPPSWFNFDSAAGAWADHERSASNDSDNNCWPMPLLPPQHHHHQQQQQKPRAPLESQQRWTPSVSPNAPSIPMAVSAAAPKLDLVPDWGPLAHGWAAPLSSSSSSASSSSPSPTSSARRTRSGLPSTVSSAGGWRLLTPVHSRAAGALPAATTTTAAVAEGADGGGGSGGAVWGASALQAFAAAAASVSSSDVEEWLGPAVGADVGFTKGRGWAGGDGGAGGGDEGDDGRQLGGGGGGGRSGAEPAGAIAGAAAAPAGLIDREAASAGTAGAAAASEGHAGLGLRSDFPEPPGSSMSMKGAEVSGGAGEVGGGRATDPPSGQGGAVLRDSNGDSDGGGGGEAAAAPAALLPSPVQERRQSRGSGELAPALPSDLQGAPPGLSSLGLWGKGDGGDCGDDGGRGAGLQEAADSRMGVSLLAAATAVAASPPPPLPYIALSPPPRRRGTSATYDRTVRLEPTAGGTDGECKGGDSGGEGCRVTGGELDLLSALQRRMAADGPPNIQLPTASSATTADAQDTPATNQQPLTANHGIELHDHHRLIYRNHHFCRNHYNHYNHHNHHNQRSHHGHNSNQGNLKSAPCPPSPPLCRTVCNATVSAPGSVYGKSPRRSTTRERLINLLSSLDVDGVTCTLGGGGTAVAAAAVAAAAASSGPSRSGSLSVLSTSPPTPCRLVSRAPRGGGAEGAGAGSGGDFRGCAVCDGGGGGRCLPSLQRDRRGSSDQNSAINGSCSASQVHYYEGRRRTAPAAAAAAATGYRLSLRSGGFGATSRSTDASPSPSPQSPYGAGAYGSREDELVHAVGSPQTQPQQLSAGACCGPNSWEDYGMTMPRWSAAGAGAAGPPPPPCGPYAWFQVHIAIRRLPSVQQSAGVTGGGGGGVRTEKETAAGAGAAAGAAAAGVTPAVAAAPGGASVVLLLNATDVSEWVETQERLEGLLQEEHKVLEAIFPRHVIEHLARRALWRSPSATFRPAAAAACPSCCGYCRGGDGGVGCDSLRHDSRGHVASATAAAAFSTAAASGSGFPGAGPGRSMGPSADPDAAVAGGSLPSLEQRKAPAAGGDGGTVLATAAAAAVARSGPVPLPGSSAGGGGGFDVGGGGGCFHGGGGSGPPLATAHRCVTVLFADIVGFTTMCNCLEPLAVMTFLNSLYTRFDTLCDIFGVYKVETIGDCFMAVGGLITVDGEGFKAVRGDGSEDSLHAVKVMSFAKAMLREVGALVMPHNGQPLRLRVGLHSGPVTAGIVGAKMPRFCLFGDTVNTASRMESTCEPGAIHASAATRELLPGEAWTATGGVHVKGKGEMQTFLWRPPAPPSDCGSLGLLPTHGSSSGSRAAYQSILTTGSAPPPATTSPRQSGSGGFFVTAAGLRSEALAETASAPLPGSVSPPLRPPPPPPPQPQPLASAMRAAMLRAAPPPGPATPSAGGTAPHWAP